MKKYDSSLGRCTKHCTLYKRDVFENRFIKCLIYSLISVYLGIFLKVYIFDWLIHEVMGEKDLFGIQWRMKWTYASAISYGPIFLLYSRELLIEAVGGKKNFNQKKVMLKNFILLSINKTLSDQEILEQFGKK